MTSVNRIPLSPDPSTPVLTAHIAVLGHGKVGQVFIDQLIRQVDHLREYSLVDLRIFAIGDTRRLLLTPDGVTEDWEKRINALDETSAIPDQIIRYARDNKLYNLIMVDNTASDEIAKIYPQFCTNGFDIVSANKRANTLPWDEYQYLRKVLLEQGKTYRYETNVGAGLPLIDNIKMLHLSGERIHRIYGVFSGSLSYIFNAFDDKSRPLSEIVDEAIRLGYAEPDVREDLCGLDVARKVLILARELDIDFELDQVEVENLVPEELRGYPYEEFGPHIPQLEAALRERQAECNEDEVLRYVGEVIWDDEKRQARLRTALERVPRRSIIGSLTHADCGFEIYTESYGSRPIVVQGAGAGTKVTARGILGDVLRIVETY